MKPHEAHFKLHPPELPVKNRELTEERMAAEAELGQKLGTLRYLTGLKHTHQQPVAQLSLLRFYRLQIALILICALSRL